MSTFALLLSFIIGCAFAHPSLKDTQDPGNPLFLTPLISEGLFQEARDAALVSGLPITGGDIESYSGFITVNPEFNSNIFFWYFPALSGDPKAPVVLWLEGGPAVSVQLPLFTENGPFTIEDNMTLTVKSTSWAQTHSMIYIESPVGTGFSFLDDAAGLDTNANQTAANSYEFLTQFFQMFPNEQANDFYIGGVSYGGKYVPALAYKIHVENQGTPKVPINLKGFLMEAPWVDPVNQVLAAEYLYHLGFINETIRDEMELGQEEVKRLINSGNYDAASTLWNDLTVAPGSLFLRATGMKDQRALYHFYLDLQNPKLGYFEDFVVLPEIRRSIHVGNAGYAYFNTTVSEAYGGDIMVSYRTLLETLLDAPEGYRVAIYPGQFDIFVGYKGVENMLRNLNWAGKDEYPSSPRTSWMIGDYVAGFSKTVRNLTYILVRNAGHSISRDQTGWTHDIMQRISSGTPF